MPMPAGARRFARGQRRLLFGHGATELTPMLMWSHPQLVSLRKHSTATRRAGNTHSATTAQGVDEGSAEPSGRAMTIWVCIGGCCDVGGARRGR